MVSNAGERESGEEEGSFLLLVFSAIGGEAADRRVVLVSLPLSLSSRQEEAFLRRLYIKAPLAGNNG